MTGPAITSLVAGGFLSITASAFWYWWWSTSWKKGAR